MEREEVGFVVGGTRCAAWLFRPEGSGPAPCVVIWGRASPASATRASTATASGSPRRGSPPSLSITAIFGDSEGEPRTLLSARMQREDFRAAVAFARSLDRIDRQRIAIWGFSFGGAHAQQIAIADPSDRGGGLRLSLDRRDSFPRHMGGLGHFVQVMAAGCGTSAGPPARAEPFRIPAGGPPESGAALCTRDANEGFRRSPGRTRAGGMTSAPAA